MYHVPVTRSLATLAATTVDDLWTMTPRSSLKNDHHKAIYTNADGVELKGFGKIIFDFEF